MQWGSSEKQLLLVVYLGKGKHSQKNYVFRAILFSVTLQKDHDSMGLLNFFLSVSTDISLSYAPLSTQGRIFTRQNKQGTEDSLHAYSSSY
jgi:hypothetical protein